MGGEQDGHASHCASGVESGKAQLVGIEMEQEGAQDLAGVVGGHRRGRRTTLG
jgi:hypothetical protein